MKRQLHILIITIACAATASAYTQIGEGFRKIGTGIGQVARGSVDAVTGWFRGEKKSEPEQKKHEQEETKQHVQKKKRKNVSGRGE